MSTFDRSYALLHSGRRPSSERPSWIDKDYSVGKGRALLRRTLALVYTFGLFSAVAAAIIALRVFAFLPPFPQ